MSLPVITAIGGWVSSYFERKAVEQQAQAERAKDMQVSSDNYDTAALKAMQFTWKDEYLMGIFTFPLILAWKYPEKATAWIDFVSELPIWYQVILGGMVASTYGLRWWFKREQTKVYTDILNKGS